MAARYSRRWSALVGSFAVLVLTAVLSLADDEENKPAEDNPYLPREGLSAEELRSYIDRMQQAPKSVQLQPGFTDAINVAVDRILAANPSDELRVFALGNKMQALHRSAAYGDEKAQKKLIEVAKESKSTPDKELARWVEFYLLEDRALDAGKNAKTDELPKLLDELKKFFAAQPELDARHLRMASATVKIINRVADDELAQKSYKEFGELWGKSQELELGRYGRSIAKGTRRKAPDVTGKPMPIMGTTHDGKSFDLAQWRGKPVLVLFWATWCGPCRELMPEFKAIYEHYHADGFEIIGVSKDDDKDALSMYIDEQELPWPNLFDVDADDSEKHPIADKYGVHAIPSTFLLDREGKVIAEDLHGEPLAEKIEELMAAKSGAADKPADGAKKPDEKKDDEKKDGEKQEGDKQDK